MDPRVITVPRVITDPRDVDLPPMQVAHHRYVMTASVDRYWAVG
jgi:hypothetical protein